IGLAPLSLGHASILASLRHHNIDVFSRSWSVNVPNFLPDDVVEFIMMHANPWKVILGGPQVSYVKKGIEEYYPYADIFIRGYAENALVKLMLSKKPFPYIKGVHYFGKPDLGLSAVTELDTLPSPFLNKFIPPQRFIRWETQRGCPFRCAFCQHRESDVSMKRRQFPMSRVIQEAEWIAKHSNIQDVAVLDPTFNSGPYYQFLDKVVQLNDTAETILEFGLQTTNPKEQAIIDRPNNMKIVEKVLTQSIDFCFNHKVPVIHAFPLMLLRGTPLHERKTELGLVESYEVASPKIDRVQTDIPHVVASPSFTYEDWKEMSKIAESLETSAKNISKSFDGKHNVEITSSLQNFNTYIV
ncbi:16910_t:CDS:2, partial [Dentiscutata heterogama]